VRSRKLGKIWLSPLDVVLNDRLALIVQPDLFFVSNARAWIVNERVRGAPDLMIEVLSPKPRIGKTSERVKWFKENGVRECWLVHQDQRSVTVIAFEDYRDRIGGAARLHVVAGRDSRRIAFVGSIASHATAPQA